MYTKLQGQAKGFLLNEHFNENEIRQICHLSRCFDSVCRQTQCVNKFSAFFNHYDTLIVIEVKSFFFLVDLMTWTEHIGEDYYTSNDYINMCVLEHSSANEQLNTFSSYYNLGKGASKLVYSVN